MLRPPLRLLVVGEVLHVSLHRGAVLLSRAVEALVLGTIQTEPLLPVAVMVVAALAWLVRDHRARFLAHAMLRVHGPMRAIDPTVTVPARGNPIPAS